MSNNTLGCTDKQGAEHGGEARRGRHAQAADGSTPDQVIRGCKLQDGDGEGVIADYVAFTLPLREGESPRQLADWLLGHMPGGATVRDYGRFGYSQGFDLPGGGFILYHPQRPEMGVYCALPSGALPLLDMSPRALFAMVLAEEGQFKRLDLAIDSHEVTMAQVRAACAPRDNAPRGDCVTRARSAPSWNDLWRPGDTLYIGSRSSDAVARFYDKAAEQKVGGIWTRCEVELKHSSAQRAVIAILQGGDPLSLIVGVVDFRDRAADSNVSRCPRLPWWEAWIGSARRMVFPVVKAIEKTAEEAFAWVVKQVAPTLAFLDKWKVARADPHWLFRLCDDNNYRIPIQRRLLLEGG